MVFNSDFSLPLNSIKNWKRGKTHWNKSKNLTHHTDFALISTHFVRWGCNFTWSSTCLFFVFYWPKSQKAFKKSFFMAQSELSLFSGIIVRIYIDGGKNQISKNCQRLVQKITQNGMYIVLLHVKLQPQWTKCVEMRAKSVWWVRFKDFFNAFFLFFNVWSNLKAIKKQNQKIIYIYWDHLLWKCPI